MKFDLLQEQPDRLGGGHPKLRKDARGLPLEPSVDSRMDHLRVLALSWHGTLLLQDISYEIHEASPHGDQEVLSGLGRAASAKPGASGQYLCPAEFHRVAMSRSPSGSGRVTVAKPAAVSQARYSSSL